MAHDAHAHPMPGDAHGHAGAHDHPTEAAYIKIGGILAVITALEVATFYVPMSNWILLPVLAVLSIVKFAMVVMFFMHLKFDHVLFTGFFLAGLLLAVTLIIGLLALFLYQHAIDLKTQTHAFAAPVYHLAASALAPLIS